MYNFHKYRRSIYSRLFAGDLFTCKQTLSLQHISHFLGAAVSLCCSVAKALLLYRQSIDGREGGRKEEGSDSEKQRAHAVRRCGRHYNLSTVLIKLISSCAHHSSQ